MLYQVLPSDSTAHKVGQPPVQVRALVSKQRLWALNYLRFNTSLKAQKQKGLSSQGYCFSNSRMDVRVGL